MARRKGARTLRNLLIMFGVLGVTLVLAASLNFMDFEPTLMLPEKHDPTFRMAERTAPDNALYTLSEARSLLPDIEHGEIFRAATRNLREQYRSPDGSLGNFLNVAQSIPQDPLVDWLRQCGPAVARMREAVQKPYYLDHTPRMFGWRQWDRFRTELPAACLGYAALLNHEPETLREGLEILLDCMRLSRMLWKEEGGNIESRGIEEVANQLLCLAIQRPFAKEHLAWLQEQLQQMGAPFADKHALLEQYWRAMDNTVTWRPQGYRLGHRLAIMAAARDVAYHTKQWRPVREQLYRMADEPVVRYNALFHGTPELKAVIDDEHSDLWWHIGFMREAAYQDQYFHRALLYAALQRFRNDKGVFPATLSELTPDYLSVLPADPFNFAPYLYRASGEKLVLYSPGEDNADNQGTQDDLVLLDVGAQEITPTSSPAPEAHPQ